MKTLPVLPGQAASSRPSPVEIWQILLSRLLDQHYGLTLNDTPFADERVIEQQLEFLILEGTLRPGEKLPPERELAKQFDVSRPSLREAIQRLEAKGLLLRRQGGGTFVQSSLWQSFSDPLVELLSDHPESQYDLLETRHALEGIAAYYAALRSTSTTTTWL